MNYLDSAELQIQGLLIIELHRSAFRVCRLFKVVIDTSLLIYFCVYLLKLCKSVGIHNFGVEHNGLLMIISCASLNFWH